MSDASRAKRRSVPLPPALSTPSAAQGEAAPVEAVRAIAALSAKRLGKSDVTVCFFGDGANNEGAFHEALNMASVWKLPRPDRPTP